MQAVDAGRIRRDLFYLAEDPLPCRTLNYVVPGRDKCTLYEADAYIEDILNDGGYHLARQSVSVQAFVSDPSVPWGFRKPTPEEPYYRAVNITATKFAASCTDEAVVLISHKDSQSWLRRGPGAYDNAVGVASLLEISRLISACALRRDLIFLFCNEEHWPWTSVDAARQIAASDRKVVAALNVDSIGGKSLADAGRATSVTRYSTLEGAKLAGLIASINRNYDIGLEHRNVLAERPNDDDGSFVDAGILPAVLMIGSYPYADPNYHTPADSAEKVDVEHIRQATQLVAATILTLCGLSGQ